MIRGLLLAVAIATTLAGCGSRAEAPILAEFFHASRLRDRTALQRLATTSFDPAQGMITDFQITAVAARQNGDVATKDVSISAPVRLLNGQVVQKRLVVTMELRDRRWIVSAVTEVPASVPSTPPS
jgi:hypothetical protein